MYRWLVLTTLFIGGTALTWIFFTEYYICGPQIVTLFLNSDLINAEPSTLTILAAESSQNSAERTMNIELWSVRSLAVLNSAELRTKLSYSNYLLFMWQNYYCDVLNNVLVHLSATLQIYLEIDIAIPTPAIVEPADTQSTTYKASNMLIIWMQIMSLAVFTIWSRTVGPRFRPDQMSDLTWTDLLLTLLAILIIAITLMI